MKNKISLTTLCLFLISLIALSIRSGIFAQNQKDVVLFTLGRSLNRNQVIYAANIEGEKFNLENPISVYWKMLEKNGEKEELTFLEKKMAYGIDILKNSSDEVIFKSKAIPQKTITVNFKKSKDESAPIATTEIDGTAAQLTRVYVSVKDRGAISVPKVLSLEFHGFSLVDGRGIVEIENFK